MLYFSSVELSEYNGKFLPILYVIPQHHQHCMYVESYNKIGGMCTYCLTETQLLLSISAVMIRISQTECSLYCRHV